MKKRGGFWLSLESYTWEVVGRVAPTLPYFGVGIMVLVMGASIMSAKTSLAGAYDLREASIKAARVGDYAKAQALWNQQLTITNDQRVLGNMSEEEDLVFPELVVEREIEKYEELLKKHPGHRDLYLVLANLYGQIDEAEKAQNYYELARELDPNNPMIKLEIRN